MSKAYRLVFLLLGSLFLLGIYLSGFTQVHWFIYVPLAVMAFASATGICISHNIFKKMGL